MTICIESHSKSRSGGITTTNVAIVEESTGNTRELYELQVAVYLVITIWMMIKTKKSKSHLSITGGSYKTSRIAILPFKFSEISMPKDTISQVDMDSKKL